MSKRTFYLEDLAKFGLTEQQFAKLSDPVQAFIEFETPSLAHYKSLSPKERQKKFKEQTERLYQKLTKRYRFSQPVTHTIDDGAVFKVQTFAPASDIAKILHEPGVKDAFIRKIGRQKRPASLRLFTISVYSELWLENKDKPHQFMEELYMLKADNDNQAIVLVKKQIKKFRPGPTINPFIDPDYKICEWRIKDIEIVEPLWVDTFPDQIIRVAWKMSAKPLKKLFS
jgi:hypothetical protein